MKKIGFLFSALILIMSTSVSAQTIDKKIDMEVFDRGFALAVKAPSVQMVENATKAENNCTYYSGTIMLSNKKAMKCTGVYNGGLTISYGAYRNDEDAEIDFVPRFKITRFNGYWNMDDSYFMQSKKYKPEFLRFYKLTRKYAKDYTLYPYKG